LPPTWRPSREIVLAFRREGRSSGSVRVHGQYLACAAEQDLGSIGRPSWTGIPHSVGGQPRKAGPISVDHIDPEILFGAEPAKGDPCPIRRPRWRLVPSKARGGGQPGGSRFTPAHPQ